VHTGWVLPKGSLPNNNHTRNEKARESKQKKKRRAMPREPTNISIKGNNTKFKSIQRERRKKPKN